MYLTCKSRSVNVFPLSMLYLIRAQRDLHLTFPTMRLLLWPLLLLLLVRPLPLAMERFSLRRHSSSGRYINFISLKGGALTNVRVH